MFYTAFWQTLAFSKLASDEHLESGRFSDGNHFSELAIRNHLVSERFSDRAI
jgi:hypothetical protein